LKDEKTPQRAEGSTYKAALALEDGSIFLGSGFGFPREVSGEGVFNTGMTGYTESLTDPSYSGQLPVQTYPIDRFFARYVNESQIFWITLWRVRSRWSSISSA